MKASPFYRIITISLCIAGVLQSTYAQSSLTVEEILSSPFPTHLTASPTSNQFAWVYNEEGVRNIYLASTRSLSKQAKALTDYQEDDGQEISQLVFTPDSKQLLYVRGGAPNSRGELPNPVSHPDGAKREIWKVSVKGGQKEWLATGYAPILSPDGSTLIFLRQGKVFSLILNQEEAPKQLFHIRGNASEISWNPNSEKNQLAFVSNRGDHAFIGIYDFANHSIQYIDPSVDVDASPVWSPDGTELAFMRFPRSKNLPFMPRREGIPWSIHHVEIQNGTSKRIWQSPAGPGSVFRSITAPQQLFWGKGNALIFPYEGDGWTHLYALPTGGGNIRCLTPGEFEVQYVSMSSDGSHIFYSSNQEDIDRQHIWKVQVQGGSPKQLSSGKGIEWSPVPLSNGQTICLASGPKTPAHVAVLTDALETKRVDQTSYEAYPSDQLVEPEAIIFSAADGMQIHGQLFMPSRHRVGEQHPAVIFFHGGSRRQMLLGFHHRGYYHNAYALNQLLASKGYVVLSVNYRSGIGYGMEFREALNYGARGASEYQDVVGAGLYLQNLEEVDPARIGLWGGSYGGFLTALGLARAPELFAAGVDIHGVHDWNVVIRNFVPSYRPETQKEAAELAYRSSPMYFIDGWEDPVLLIHGDDDRNVPFSETVDLAEALRKRHVDIEQLVFPDEVHGFLLHKNWVSAYDASVDFFERILKR
ncbi:MAG: prolyl oligopeptidase family serine peptidase [Bacteroidota bacterium]